MNRCFALAQGFSVAAGKGRLDFRYDGERNFLRRFGSDVETSGSEKVGTNRHSRISQGVEKLISPSTRPEEGDVAQAERKQPGAETIGISSL